MVVASLVYFQNVKDLDHRPKGQWTLQRRIFEAYRLGYGEGMWQIMWAPRRPFLAPDRLGEVCPDNSLPKNKFFTVNKSKIAELVVQCSEQPNIPCKVVGYISTKYSSLCDLQMSFQSGYYLCQINCVYNVPGDTTIECAVLINSPPLSSANIHTTISYGLIHERGIHLRQKMVIKWVGIELLILYHHNFCPTRVIEAVGSISHTIHICNSLKQVF